MYEKRYAERPRERGNAVGRERINPRAADYTEQNGIGEKGVHTDI